MFLIQTFYNKPDNDCVSAVGNLDTAVRMYRNLAMTAKRYYGPSYIELIADDCGDILSCWSEQTGLLVSRGIAGYFRDDEIDRVLDTTPAMGLTVLKA